MDIGEALTHYVDRLGLYKVGEEDRRAFLKGADEFDHHSVTLVQSDTAGMDFIAFKLFEEADLDHYEARVKAFGIEVEHIPAGEQPGYGRRIAFMSPSGHMIQLYHQVELSDPMPDIANPDIWPIEPHGMAARRFDHMQLNGTDVPRTLEFFTNVLDFSLTEKVEAEDGTPLAIWLSCGMKAHDVAFVEFPTPGAMHHAAFELSDWNAVGHAADIITKYDLSIDIGPTRHGITRGRTIYFFDPSGNRTEVFAEGFTYYPDHPTRSWDTKALGKGIFYYQRQLNEKFMTVVT
jgi:catechol 2,3-dioxygenase